jgi:hypothetical protein
MHWRGIRRSWKCFEKLIPAPTSERVATVRVTHDESTILSISPLNLLVEAPWWVSVALAFPVGAMMDGFRDDPWLLVCRRSDSCCRHRLRAFRELRARRLVEAADWNSVD